MIIKHNGWRRLCSIATIFIAVTLGGQVATISEVTCLDENQVRQAMREEAFRLLIQKIEAVKKGSALGFDYHIEQAYEKIKKILPSGQLSAAELSGWLRQFLQNQGTTNNEREFQTLIGHFVLGMSLEIINTLQYECDQTVDLIAQVTELAEEIKKMPHPNRETMDQILRQSSLDKKMHRMIKTIDGRWRIPAEECDSFGAFSVWKKNMTGRSPDGDQRLVFDLGDRYRSQYPFLDEFIKNYRHLAETFHQSARDLNQILNESSDLENKAFD